MSALGESTVSIALPLPPFGGCWGKKTFLSRALSANAFGSSRVHSLSGEAAQTPRLDI